MVSDKIKVSNNGEGIREALEETERIGRYMGLSGRELIWLRLLSEETLGMIEAMVGEFNATFWIEALNATSCRINLEAKAVIEAGIKKDLLSASSTGENFYARGLMGRIADAIEEGMYRYDEAAKIQDEFFGMQISDEQADRQDGFVDIPYYWSLDEYRKEMAKQKERDSALNEMIDDHLEKSIVAHIADDITVGVRDRKVKLIISKEF